MVAIDETTDLIATTLWANIHPGEAHFTERGVNDFHRIKNGERRLSWDRFNDEHSRCRQFLEQSLAQSKAENIIVVSHHVPSFELMSQEFSGSHLNGAFTVELGNVISNSRIKYWIYGHSHRNINKKIGSTQCLSNQLGYVSHGEHRSFRHDAIINL